MRAMWEKIKKIFADHSKFVSGDYCQLCMKKTEVYHNGRYWLVCKDCYF